MCGIAGIWGAADEELIRRMTAMVAHRGPDDSGVLAWHKSAVPVSLGHRRLSIIDLTKAGHQPMANEDESVWTVFNGEIYNFQELRGELLAAGHRFKSRTDTEVLLHAFEEWGIEFVQRLNGIFAFALWDRVREELHLVRDPYGVKPLYYTRKGDRTLFGSEIKSLLCDSAVSRDVDPDALLSYLQFRYCPEALSLFRDVRKVMPGEVLTLRKNQSSSWRYYELKFSQPAAGESVASQTERLRERLIDAVRRQMVSDVPVGLFLSGGVDSGGLLAMVRTFESRPLKTFTIGFRRQDQHFEQQPEDVGYARTLATQYETDHHEIILEPKIVDLLPKVIWHLDEPVADPAAITSYLICEAARGEGAKVLLSGQGGDEVFGGYPWHLGGRIARYYRYAPRCIRAVTERFLNRLPAAKGGRATGTFRRLRKFGASASLGFEESQIAFLSYASPQNLLGLLGTEFVERIDDGVPERVHRELLERSRGQHHINRMLYLDMCTFLPSLNLAYTDKTGMAFGVEVRVPYIDKEVVNFMAQVPPHLKLHGFKRKYLMKRALRKMLPWIILHRRKAGFGAPIRTWIVSDLREMIDDLLAEATLRRRGYFEPAYVRSIIAENAAGRHDYSYFIYTLLSFELWCQAYLDRN